MERKGTVERRCRLPCTPLLIDSALAWRTMLGCHVATVNKRATEAPSKKPPWLSQPIMRARGNLLFRDPTPTDSNTWVRIEMFVSSSYCLLFLSVGVAKCSTVSKNETHTMHIQYKGYKRMCRCVYVKI